MVKKQIATILIISICLSLIPDSSYNKNREVLAYLAQSGECKWKGKTEIIYKSCFGEIIPGIPACGREIPIGEALDRTTILASKMEREFVEGIVGNANLLIKKTEDLLAELPDWTCTITCKSECYKYLKIHGYLQIPLPGCAGEATTTKSIREPCQECKGESIELKCEDFYQFPPYSWQTVVDDTICNYVVNYSEPNWCTTSTDWCMVLPTEGKCDWYSNPFEPILETYEKLYGSLEMLKNDVEGTGDTPKQFKKDDILDQVDFSRCELFNCALTPEEYPKVLAGEIAGKHLLTCKSVTEAGLLNQDQLTCMFVQMLSEKCDTLKGERDGEEHFSRAEQEKLKKETGSECEGFCNCTFCWCAIRLAFKFIFGLLQSFFKRPQVCHPANFYCCEITPF